MFVGRCGMSSTMISSEAIRGTPRRRCSFAIEMGADFIGDFFPRDVVIFGGVHQNAVEVENGVFEERFHGGGYYNGCGATNHRGEGGMLSGFSGPCA